MCKWQADSPASGPQSSARCGKGWNTGTGMRWGWREAAAVRSRGGEPGW